MKLKTWQKWGIAFGVIHVLVSSVFLYLRRFDTGCPSIYIILFWLDFPVSFIAGATAYLSKLIIGGNTNDISVDYIIYNHMISGSLVYLLIGSIIGSLVNKIKNIRVPIFFALCGILVIILAMFPVVMFFWGGLGISFFPLGIIFLSVSFFSWKKIKYRKHNESNKDHKI